jgi:hypothetical protein
MTAKELADVLAAEIVSKGNIGREIVSGMVCDGMSLSIARGCSGMAWVCQRADINVLAVAVMTDAACVIFPQCTQLDEKLIQRAEAENISILITPKSAFEAVGQMYAAGIRPERSRK